MSTSTSDVLCRRNFPQPISKKESIMNTKVNTAENSGGMTVKMGGYSLTLNEQIVGQLAAIAEDDWAALRELLALLDSVATQLSIRGCFAPSDDGKAAALRVVADMKQFLYPLIGDQTYEQFR